MNKGIAPGELVLLIPDSVTSKEKLSKFLEDSGYKRGTPEYWEFYKAYSGNYKSEYEHLNQ
jgi:hypothetical protein